MFEVDLVHILDISSNSCIVRYSINVKSVKCSRKRQLRRSAAKFRPMYLLLAGNDSVSFSVWRGGGYALY